MSQTITAEIALPQIATRRRSDGPLCGERQSACHAAGLPLAYDPAQTGWVPLGAIDDFHARALVPSACARLGFRAWRSGDIDRFHALLDDPEVWAFLPQPYPAPLSRANAATLVELANASPHHMVHAVTYQGAPIGQARLEFAGQGRAEISYWLGRAHWGRGFGRDLVRAYTAFVATEVGDIHTLFARIHRNNTASRRVVERAGYKYDGPDPQDPALDLFSRVVQ
jgi:RimJ/RimL family protein N-acetyltransferase